MLNRVLIYTRRVEEMVAFYHLHFGFTAVQAEGDRIVELTDPDGGTGLLLHPAGKGQKQGQSLVKLVFTVPDVVAFCQAAGAKGLEFGPVHHGDGYEFANARDPSGNPVSVTTRPQG